MLTTDEYICNLKRHGVENTVPDEPYRGTNTPIYHICKIHNHRFKAQPSNVMNGYPCPLCNEEKFRLQKEEKYRQELINRNIPIMLDDKYISVYEKVYHICLQCGNRWKTSPRYVYKNDFPCPECAKKERAKLRTKTQNEFKYEIKEIFGNSISISGKYTKSKEPIDVHCNICNHDWHPLATSLLSGHGCPKCTNHYTMSNEEFLNKVKNFKNKNTEIISEYIDSKTPIKCKCYQCGNIWNTTLDRILQGNGCRKCADDEQAKLRTISLDEITKRLHEHFPHIDIIGEYKNIRVKTMCKCNICNNVWSTQLSSLLIQKYGCPKCAIEANKSLLLKTHDEYIKEVLLSNPNINVLTQYKGGSNNIKAQCLLCNNEWTTKAHNLLRCGCPKCTSSKGESLVQTYLDKQNIYYTKAKKYSYLLGIGNRQLSYDFYLPKYNLLIECQGAQHEHPVKYFGGKKQFIVQKIHDTRKRRYAYNHNINLLEIWYYENNKIDKILTQTLNNLKSECRETVIPA